MSKRRPRLVRSQIPGVVFQPQTYQSTQRGIAQIVDALRPTLGPVPRHVAVSGYSNTQGPELLDDGGLIARRIIELPDRDADMGAMLLRQMLWHLREEVGDGTATAAVLLEAIFRRGVHYVSSGGNAMLLRSFLEQSAALLCDKLAGLAFPVEGREALTQFAGSVCHDPELSAVLGEIFEVLGEYAVINLQSGRGRQIEHEYVHGTYWASGLFSRQMITDTTAIRSALENAAIFISDLELNDPHELVPIIEATLASGRRGLVIVASRLSENAISLMLHASKDPDRFQALAVKTPGQGKQEQFDALEDLGKCTGGRALLQAAGDSAANVRSVDLGWARSVWADRDFFCIVEGSGDRDGLSRHLLSLDRSFRQAAEPESRERLRRRIGRLMGASATLWVGGSTDIELETRKRLAERTVAALRGAAHDGVVPGGGVSLMLCQPALREKLAQTSDPDERAAYQILIDALEIPMRTIVTNAGYDSGQVMAKIKLAGDGFGLDVHSGQVIDMTKAGILDAVAVQQAALRSAIATAALALTTDVLVHRREPEYSSIP
jgi:chaperonin GroEL